ncbi:MAG: DUF5686 family protein [Rikenellaceae bacterium]
MFFKNKYCFLILVCLFVGSITVNGQRTYNAVLKGIVVDGKTDKPIPLASVAVEGTKQGTITDLEGKFSISTNIPNTILKASCMGYNTEIIKISDGSSNLIKIKLTSSLTTLDKVVVKANRVRYKNKNNIAVSFIDSVIANKDKNRNENFDFLQYEKYEKTQFALSNISEEIKQSKMLKKFKFVFENIDTTKQPGKEVLPLYIKETLSDYYYRKSPKATNEVVKANKMVSFDGYLNNEGITAYLKYLYQDINIYDNNISFLTNQFLSPIANSAPMFYRFYITDTVNIDDAKCAKLFFTPRSKTDMLFQGYLFITLDGAYAVKKIDMEVNKKINLNWVKDAKIIQEFEYSQQQGWVMSKDELSVNFGFNQNGLGIFGQRSVLYKNYLINKTLTDNVFNISAPKIDAVQKSDAFWEQNRYEQLTKSEKGIYTTMDSLQHVPAFKRTMDIMRIAFASFHDFGPFEIGPISTFYSYNSIEGSKIKFGGRSTPEFSKKINFDGYLTYGFKDKKYKYNIGATYSFTSNTIYEFPVKRLRVNYQVDTKVPGQELYFLQEGNALMSFKRGVDDKLFYNKSFKVEYLNEFENHFSYSVGYNYTRQSPGGTLNFNTDDYLSPVNNIPYVNISEVGLNLRYAPHEQFYQGKLYREPVPNKYPILQLKYINGSKILGNDFNYNRLKLSIYKKFYPSVIGYTTVIWEAGKTFGKVPYPLLEIHNANQTYVYQSTAYSLMNFLEFVSDQYTSLNVDHCFNGFIFNKIPLLKALGLRENVTCKVLYGSLSKSNNPDYQSDLFKFPTDKEGNPTIFALGNSPYVEVGVGISNIFKLIRLDFVKRLTYLNHPNVSSTGIRMMLKFDI